VGGQVAPAGDAEPDSPSALRPTVRSCTAPNLRPARADAVATTLRATGAFPRRLREPVINLTSKPGDIRPRVSPKALRPRTAHASVSRSWEDSKMAQIGVWSKFSSKIIEKTHSLARICIRGLAVVAIVGTYGVGQVLGVMGVSGVVMTASTTPAQAWRGGWGGGWGRGGWGRGGWGRGGWGGGGRGCRGWRGGRCWWWW
jgi:hypothetical protein